MPPLAPFRFRLSSLLPRSLVLIALCYISLVFIVSRAGIENSQLKYFIGRRIPKLSFTGYFKFALPTSFSGVGSRPSHSLAFAVSDVSKGTLSSSASIFNDVPIYVLSLRERTDRQEQMEVLREALGFQWAYFYATDADSKVVNIILERIYLARMFYFQRHGLSGQTEGFSWPDESLDDALLGGFGEESLVPTFDLGPSGRDTMMNISDGEDTSISSTDLSKLTCATGNDTITPYNSSTPDYERLTPARIAVWYSHVSLLRKIALESSPSQPGSMWKARSKFGIAAVILEDDVDAERDISGRLEAIWGALPRDWDVVFLGHCWSNESYYPALPGTSPPARPQAQVAETDSTSIKTRLHPSHSPKCTHAYAVSPQGARRLLRHLLHPPFAYSRALDQAIAWLVLSQRLRSYSVVPSVVVQMKQTKSDVDGRTRAGSKWKDTLVDGVLQGRVQSLEVSDQG